ncbi:MAG: hypothetical protein R3A13_05905 [Bdellovibrionota bacterium]
MNPANSESRLNSGQSLADSSSPGRSENTQLVYRNIRSKLAFEIAATSEPKIVLEALVAKFNMDRQFVAGLFFLKTETQDFQTSLTVKDALKVCQQRSLNPTEVLFFLKSEDFKDFVVGLKELSIGVDLTYTTKLITFGKSLIAPIDKLAGMKKKIKAFAEFCQSVQLAEVKPRVLSPRHKMLEALVSGFRDLSSQQILSIRINCLQQLAEVNKFNGISEAFHALWPKFDKFYFERIIPSSPPEKLSGMTPKVLFKALKNAPNLPPELYLAFASFKSDKLLRGVCKIFNDRQQARTSEVSLSLHKNRSLLLAGQELPRIDPACFILSEARLEEIRIQSERLERRSQARSQVSATKHAKSLKRKQAGSKPLKPLKAEPTTKIDPRPVKPPRLPVKACLTRPATEKLWTGPKIIPASKFSLIKVEQISQEGHSSGGTIAINGRVVSYSADGIKAALAEIADLDPQDIADDACLADFMPSNFKAFDIYVEQTRFEVLLNRYYGVSLGNAPSINATVNELMDLLAHVIPRSWFH